jgi:hypothetical protein
MVSKPPIPFRLPTQPTSPGAQIEASFGLWLASWRATLVPALVYGLAGVLPLLTLGDLATRATRWMIAATLEPYQRWLPASMRTPDEGWWDPLLVWLASPRTWALVAVAILLSLAAISVLIHRQWRIGTAQAGADWSEALTRAPAGIAAWLVYTVALLLLTLPWLALTVAIFMGGQVETMAGLAMLMLAYLFASMIATIPMAWAAVALGFAPFASVIDPIGPFAAQARSARRVRGHWIPAGVVISVPMLIYLGAAGTVSSLLLLACGAIAYALGGWVSVLEGSWLAWSNWLALVPNAALLPLAFAGGVVAWNDLSLRAAPVP